MFQMGNMYFLRSPVQRTDKSVPCKLGLPWKKGHTSHHMKTKTPWAPSSMAPTLSATSAWSGTPEAGSRPVALGKRLAATKPSHLASDQPKVHFLGQIEWYHFGIGAPPILVYILVGIGMFTKKTGVLTHDQMGERQVLLL